MEIGEPSSQRTPDESETDERPLRFEILLQDVPGTDGIPLAFTPWSLHLGARKLAEGTTGADGRVQVETLAVREGKTLWLRFPGRVIALEVDHRRSVDLSCMEQMAMAGYNVDNGMLCQPGHYERERELFERDRGNNG